MNDDFGLAKEHFINGLEAFRAGSYEIAETEFRQSLGYLPNRQSTLINLQAVLLKLNRLEDSLNVGQSILEIEPPSFEAHLNIGNVYKLKGSWTKALEHFSKAIAINPESVQSWNNRGVVNLQLQNFSFAEIDFCEALRLDQNDSDSHNNIGVLHKELRRFDKAIDVLEKSIKLRPVNPDAYNNLGNVYLELKRYSDAFQAFQTALGFNDDCPDIQYNLGNLFTELKQFDDAFSFYDKALKRKPGLNWLLGRHLLTMARLCDWRDFELQREQVLAALRAAQPAVTPFDALCITPSPENLKRCAETYVDLTCPHAGSVNLLYNHARLRIGYLSCDFRNHAVAYLMAGVWKSHNRNRFEIYGFDIGENDQSATRKKIVDSVDKFYVVSNLSDEAIAEFIRSNEIDILVDLAGHTRGARTPILAHRAAPIQVNYLGFPGTMGAPSFMDYIVADSTVVPVGAECFYSEKIIYLPDCFQANDSERSIGEVRHRSDYGLPERGIVFASFAHAAKMNPEVFGNWLSILKEVPGSVLWLIRENAQQEKNLRAFAETQGLSPDRLVFSDVLSYPEHLARYKVVDLVLDTLPFNGGTTTSDALWAGAPVLTCAGESFSGRMTSSLLTTLALKELVVESMDDYKALAIDLGVNQHKLAAIRHKLAENRKTSALFDTAKFTRNLEVAYERISDRHQAGLLPENILL